MQDQYIEINGIKTRYWQAGEHGDPILLIHGLGASIEFWEKNIAQLAQFGRVYALDLVGFGRTGIMPNVRYDVATFADFVNAFIDKFQLRNVVLVGHSLGGAIAMAVAGEQSSNVRGLVLVASAGFGTNITWLFRVMTVPVIGELILWPRFKSSIRRTVKRLVYHRGIVEENFVNRLYALPSRRKIVLKTLRGSSSIRGVHETGLSSFINQVRKLDIPMLIIWGNQDKVVPVTHAHHAVKIFEHAQLQLLNQCGHFPQYEHSELFNDTVTKFMQQLK